ncbi:hypothetical protein KUCAC02_029857, partial [Chaenocephalus aceratus]
RSHSALPLLTPFHPSIPPFTACLHLVSASPLTPSHSTPMHLRGFHMEMTFLTGHI